MFFKHHLKKKKATNLLAALISSGDPWIFLGGKHFYHLFRSFKAQFKVLNLW